MRVLDPRLMRRARAARVAIGLDAVIGVVAALLILSQAVLIATIAARAFDGESLSDLTLALVVLVAVVIARAGSAWGFEVVGRRAAIGVLSELRRDVVRSRLRDSHAAALDNAESAEIATAAVAGVDALEVTFARYLPQVVLALVVPLAVLILVALIDPLSAIIMLVTLPLVPVFMWLLGRHTERVTRDRWRSMALLATHFLDVVRGLPTLRAFNRGEAQVERVAAVSEEYRVAVMRTLRVAFLSGSILEFAATLGIALVAVTIGVRLVDGEIAFASALTVLLLAPELYLPLRNVAAQFHASSEGQAVAERLLDLLDESDPDSPLDNANLEVRAGALKVPDARKASVRLEGVSFTYPTRDLAVLDRLDLELSARETVALVGPSGGGKSTLAALLLGFAQPTEGRLTVGGVNIANCDRSAWRAQIAWVPQKPTLFRASVADNIRLGDDSADDSSVRAAAVMAGADGFIDDLPDGYETVVGDGGRPVSAGQRRRIALARAFLRDASLVILDEPTADLDESNAELVGEAIERLCEGRTVLMIAHRPELAARADRIVVLNAGRITQDSRRTP